MSARTDIRDGIVTRLRAVTGVGQALAGYTVESSRVDPTDDPDLSRPSPKLVLVYADNVRGETETRGTYGAAFASRDTVSVEIDVLCSGDTGAEVETAIDAVEAGVLDTLLGDQTWLDNLADHPIVTASNGVIRQPSGRLRGLFSVTIECVAPAREVP